MNGTTTQNPAVDETDRLRRELDEARRERDEARARLREIRLAYDAAEFAHGVSLHLNLDSVLEGVE